MIRVRIDKQNNLRNIANGQIVGSISPEQAKHFAKYRVDREILAREIIRKDGTRYLKLFPVNPPTRKQVALAAKICSANSTLANEYNGLATFEDFRNFLNKYAYTIKNRKAVRFGVA